MVLSSASSPKAIILRMTQNGKPQSALTSLEHSVVNIYAEPTSFLLSTQKHN